MVGSWEMKKGRESIATLRFSLVGGAGFEPTKAEPVDLQSTPFDRFGIPPS